ncbi:MAG: bilirubin oxidase, partial [Anaerolineales bacterium]
MAMRYGLQRAFAAPVAGGTLAPGDVDKFVLPLVKPPAMPPSKSLKNKDLYKIGVRQFNQRILSTGHPETTVWSYGSVDHPGTVAEGGTFNYPAFTIEAVANKKATVEWRNELVDVNGNFLPHLLSVDQTLHWANPPGGKKERDRRGFDPSPYVGPVPIVTHVHGAHTTEESDGYAEAWWLPNAGNIPKGYADTGTFYDYFVKKYKLNWKPGTASFNYQNDQPATTLWYHDHTLGMTRLNVYAGPAGYWLIRGGQYDDPNNLGFVVPGVGDNPFGQYTEIPIVIQDRSFNSDGSLFYPSSRAFFEGLNVPPTEPYLDIPFIPDPAVGGMSDISPIWNPEFFGNMMVVNGNTWPNLDVAQTKYRFRFLNGCNSRFLILKTDNGMPFYQLGGDQGFLPAPVELGELLMAPAERADVVMDFSIVPDGTEVILLNLGPDEPFGGGTPGIDFDPADPDSTGIV